MLANEYQADVLRTANKALSQDEMLLNGILGMNGEAGECSEILKKHLFQGHTLDKEHLIRECGDVAFYLALTAVALGSSLEEVLEVNIAKRRERYPDGFCEFRSRNRSAGDV